MTLGAFAENGLIAALAISAARFGYLDLRMRRYWRHDALGDQLKLPGPLCWQKKFYHEAAWPLVTGAWRAFAAFGVAALLFIIVRALRGTV